MQKGLAEEAHYQLRQSDNMISLGFGALQSGKK